MIFTLENMRKKNRLLRIFVVLSYSFGVQVAERLTNKRKGKKYTGCIAVGAEAACFNNPVCILSLSTY